MAYIIYRLYQSVEYGIIKLMRLINNEEEKDYRAKKLYLLLQ
jgi:hypothetical protein